jgi:hypothetical protein
MARPLRIEYLGGRKAGNIKDGRMEWWNNGIMG